MNLKDSFIIEVGHITEVYGPVQALRNYLIKNTKKFIFISLPFSYTKIPYIEVFIYENGELKEKIKGYKKSKIQFIQWVKDFLFVIKFRKKQKEKADVFIGVDNLNALTGIILKKFKRVNRVIYYIIDHMDRRFKNPIFNFLYRFVDKIACKKSDFIWSLSGRIKKRKEELFRFNTDKNIIVPVGIEIEKVGEIKIKEKLKSKTAILMSHLDETKGVDLLLHAFKEVVDKLPDAYLYIIGTGPYEEKLKALSKKLNLEKNVEFLGAMEHTALLKFISKYRIGIAPYKDDKNSYTYYADPTKPKEYLACGLPLIITDVPWISEKVKELPMGIVCKYDKDDLKNAILKLLADDDFYKICLNNALLFTKDLSWDKIYSDAFKKVSN